jgi:polysaccharide biosynthesis protein PslH
MRSLLLTQVLPYPPDSGPKVKTWNVIKYLAREHAVTLASFTRGDQSSDVAQLRGYCEAVHTIPMERGALRDGAAMARSLVAGQPWMMVRDHRAAMARLVDRLARDCRFDVVHADQLNMAQYALRVPARRVLDAHNALWVLYRRLAATMPHGPRRWLLEREWRLLRAYEGRMVRAFDAVLAVSDEDRAALLGAAGGRRDVANGGRSSATRRRPSANERHAFANERSTFAVIPIAVDTDEVTAVARPLGADHILHVGTMYWPPNIDGIRWFVEEALPLIRARRPGVTLDLVGSRPPEWLVALAARDPRIRVPGYVADLTPYLEATGAFVVPLRAGGGMRVKILNAMAQALPIVSTTLGYEGIDLVPGKHLLVGDTPNDLAAAVARLLEDQPFARALGERARRLVVERYDYRRACLPLDAVYAGGEAARPAAAPSPQPAGGR